MHKLRAILHAIDALLFSEGIPKTVACLKLTLLGTY